MGRAFFSSFAVERIKTFASSIPATLFAYHYCAFSDPDSQQLINILGSVAVQISAWQPSILEDLRGTFEREKARKQGKTLQIGELEHILVRYMSTFSTAIILVDALDESEDFFESTNCILGLLQQLPNLKVMVTSTRRATTATTNPWPYLTEIEMQPDEDIRTFVQAKLSDHVALRHLSSEYKDTVKSVLIGNADQS